MTNDATSTACAIWLTGLPASGKSTIVAALKPQLEGVGIEVEVLESDAVRQVLTPTPTYSPIERDLFYRALAFMGAVPGLQEPYEVPLNPEVRIDTTKVKASEAAEMVMDAVRNELIS